MNLQDYQTEALRTMADRERTPFNKAMAALGLMDEMEEFKTVLRKKHSAQHNAAARRAKILDEGGDALWYPIILADQYDISGAEIEQAKRGILNASRWGKPSKLEKAAQKIASFVKKDLWHGHPTDRGKLVRLLARYINRIEGSLLLTGIGLEDAMRGNVEKLQKRYAKGFSTEASIARVDVEDA